MSWARINGPAEAGGTRMGGALTIARLTWMEARRRRIVLAALIGGVLFLLLFGLVVVLTDRYAEGSAMTLRVQFLVLVQGGLFVATFLSYAVAILLPVDTLSGEIDSGIMQTLASKPIRRSAIVLGKALTYWLIAVAYLLLLALGIILIGQLVAGVAPSQLERVLPLMALGTSVPLAASIAGGSCLKTITNGMVGFAYFGLAFLGGMIEQIGTVAGNQAAARIGTAISLVNPSDAMWRRAAYEMVPDVMRDFVRFTPWGAASWPSDAMIVWAIGVVIALLLLSLYLFGRRAL